MGEAEAWLLLEIAIGITGIIIAVYIYRLGDEKSKPMIDMNTVGEGD